MKNIDFKDIKLKKQLMIVGIIIILLAVGLSGCNSSDKDKLVGTWVSTDEDVGSTFSLFSNGRNQGLPEELSFWIDQKWDVKDHSLIFYSGTYERAYGCYFATKGDSILIILTRGNFICEYEKQ